MTTNQPKPKPAKTDASLSSLERFWSDYCTADTQLAARNEDDADLLTAACVQTRSGSKLSIILP